jgi:hypothetical protein
MSEINPNHPVTIKTRDQWHKIAALLMSKAGHDEVVITSADIDKLLNSDRANIVIRYRQHDIQLRLVDNKEAARLAREEGGLPV